MLFSPPLYRVLKAMPLGRALTMRAMLCKACKGGLSVRLRCHVIITSYETVILVTSVSEHYLVAVLHVPVLGLDGEGDAVGQGLDGEGDAVQGLQSGGLSTRFR